MISTDSVIEEGLVIEQENIEQDKNEVKQLSANQVSFSINQQPRSRKQDLASVITNENDKEMSDKKPSRRKQEVNTSTPISSRPSRASAKAVASVIAAELAAETEEDNEENDQERDMIHLETETVTTVTTQEKNMLEGGEHEDNGELEDGSTNVSSRVGKRKTAKLSKTPQVAKSDEDGNSPTRKSARIARK